MSRVPGKNFEKIRFFIHYFRIFVPNKISRTSKEILLMGNYRAFFSILRAQLTASSGISRLEYRASL